MTINIKSPQVSPDAKLVTYIEKKLSKLETFYDRITDADAVLKLENAGQIKDKIVEIKMHVPGEVLFVKEVDKTFEAAADSAADTMKRKLIKFKERQRAHR